MVKFLSIILNFYRRFLWVSLFLNVLLYFLAFELAIAFTFKFILALFLYWSYDINGRGKELVFYHNLGWGSKKLFLLVFAIDICLLSLIYRTLDTIV